MSIPAYWISAYVWDACLFIFPAALCLSVIYMFNIEILIQEMGPFLIVIGLFGSSVISFTYLTSFIFKSHSTAQSIMLQVYMFTSSILVIAYIIMDFFE